MSALGSFDHRAFDGARLMHASKRLAEQPLGMLL